MCFSTCRILDYRITGSSSTTTTTTTGQQHLGNFAELSPRNISQFQSIATQLRNSPSSIKPFLDNSIAERKSTGKLVLAMVVTLFLDIIYQACSVGGYTQRVVIATSCKVCLLLWQKWLQLVSSYLTNDHLTKRMVKEPAGWNMLKSRWMCRPKYGTKSRWVLKIEHR